MAKWGNGGVGKRAGCLPAALACFSLGVLVTGMPAGASEAPAGVQPGAEPPAAAAPGPAPRTVLLRCCFRQGDTIAYRVLVAGKGVAFSGAPGVALPLSVEGEAAVSEKVLAARTDGSAEVEIATEWRRFLLNGKDALAVASERIAVSVDACGRLRKVLRRSGSRAPAVDAAVLAGLAGALAFPEEPVRVGQTWSQEPAGGTSARASTTLCAIEQGKAGEVMRLKRLFSGPVPGAPAKGSGIQAGDLAVAFDAAAGRVLSAAGSVDCSLTFPGAAGAMEVRLRVEVNGSMRSMGQWGQRPASRH